MTEPDPLPGPATVLEHALLYAAHGWRVIPVTPGEKYPKGIPAWQNLGTTDAETITSWWTGLYRDWGIGILTGPESGIWVLDVDVADGKTGDETLRDIENSYAELPDTMEAISARGGRHLFFRWPDGADIRAGAATRLGEGLDVRGIGGQVLAQPTIGPFGGVYSWVDGQGPGEIEVADAPPWLIAICETPVAAPSVAPTRQMAQHDDGPAAAFNAATTWPQLLERDGWQLHHTERDGEQKWTRPDKPIREGPSATVGHQGRDILKVFTSSVPQLEAEKAYSRFGYEAAMRHHGDRSGFARHLVANGYGTPHQPTSDDLTFTPSGVAAIAAELATPPPLTIRWVPELADGNMPPEPAVLVEGLLRRGEMCVFGAPRAIGKTWLAYNLATLLAEGEGRFLGTLPVANPARVLYLQGELDQWGSAVRWNLLTGDTRPLPNVAETFDRLRFRTVKRREVRSIDGTSFTDEYVDASIDERLEHAIIDHQVDVVIVDPWAVYLAASENSNDEVEAVLGSLREITLRTGVAWVIIHHITGKAERSSWTEPEDLWRGATRLADWASTRVTVLPHYTEAQYKELGMNRREARRHADVHFLRRSTPTDDFSMRLDAGWWTAWDPGDEQSSSAAIRIARALTDNGGTFTSLRNAATALDVSPHTAKKLIADAAQAGLVHVDEGARGSFVVTLQDVQAPWRPVSSVLHDRASTARRADNAESAQTNAQPKTQPDQEEHPETAPPPRTTEQETCTVEKAQVSPGFSPPRAPSPPTGGTPTEVAPPEGDGVDATATHSDSLPDDTDTAPDDDTPTQGYSPYPTRRPLGSELDEETS